jgi:hypothetical protein
MCDQFAVPFSRDPPTHADVEDASRQLDSGSMRALHAVCPAHGGARGFAFLYGVVNALVRGIARAISRQDPNRRIDSTQAWAMVLPFLNATATAASDDGGADDTVRAWSRRMQDTLFTEFALRRDVGIGALLLDAKTFVRPAPHSVRTEFFHFVHMAFAARDPAMLAVVREDARYWVREDEVNVESPLLRRDAAQDAERLAFLRSLFFVMAGVYMGDDRRVRQLAGELLRYDRAWDEVAYDDDMPAQADAVRARIAGLWDVTAQFVVARVREVFQRSLAEPPGSSMLTQEMLFRLALERGEKLDAETRRELPRLLEAFLWPALPEDGTLSNDIVKQLRTWTTENAARLTGSDDVDREKFNTFYARVLLDARVSSLDVAAGSIGAAWCSLQHARSIADAGDVLRAHDQRLALAVEELHKIGTSSPWAPRLQSVDPLAAGDDRLLARLRSAYSVKDTRYDPLFGDDLRTKFADEESRRELRKVFSAVFRPLVQAGSERGLRTSVHLAFGAKDVRILSVEEGAAIDVVLVIGDTTTGSLNVYVSRGTDAGRALVVANFSLEDDWMQNINDDVAHVVGALGLPPAAIQDREVIAADDDLNAFADHTTLRTNGLGWAVWFVEGTLRGMHWRHLAEFETLFTGGQYAAYVQTVYYDQFIQPVIDRELGASESAAAAAAAVVVGNDIAAADASPAAVEPFAAHQTDRPPSDADRRDP